MFKQNAARTILTVLVALSSTIHGFAGSVIGPQMLRGQVVGAYGSKIFTVGLRGGETALVGIRGDGYTRLDLNIYDDRFTLIASERNITDQRTIRLSVYRTSLFTIEVVNRGAVYNQFDLWTD